MQSKSASCVRYVPPRRRGDEYIVMAWGGLVILRMAFGDASVRINSDIVPRLRIFKPINQSLFWGRN